jgi:hypothetical protein
MVLGGGNGAGSRVRTIAQPVACILCPFSKELAMVFNNRIGDFFLFRYYYLVVFKGL